jgi:hypothetical protein
MTSPSAPASPDNLRDVKRTEARYAVGDEVAVEFIGRREARFDGHRRDTGQPAFEKRRG